MSFQAVSQIDFDVKHFLNKLQNKNDDNIKIKDNKIAPNINKSHPAHSETTSSAVRVVSDPITETIETSYFKSMGKIKGMYNK